MEQRFKKAAAICDVLRQEMHRSYKIPEYLQLLDNLYYQWRLEEDYTSHMLIKEQGKQLI